MSSTAHIGRANISPSVMRQLRLAQQFSSDLTVRTKRRDRWSASKPPLTAPAVNLATI
jgi:hypothetical protein